MKTTFFQTNNLMLVLFVMLSNVPFSTNAQKQHSNNPMQNQWIENYTTNIHELTAMRDRFTKHFQMQDGRYKMISSGKPLHYKTSTGWNEIDNSILVKKNGQYDTHPYCNDANSFSTEYPSQLLHNSLITTLKEGKIQETIEAVYATDASGTILYRYNANACQTVELSDNHIIYKNIYPNASVKYTQQSDGRRFDFILQNQQFVNSIPSQASNLVIREKIVLPQHFRIQKGEEGYAIYNGNQWISHIQTPFAADQHNQSINGKISIEQLGQEVIIYSAFSLAWLKDIQRQYPILLDPTMTFYPVNTFYSTGYMTSATGAKNSGLMRMGGASTLSWAKFSISTLPAGAILSDGHFHGDHYNGLGTSDKIVSVVGMQTVDPTTATNTQIYSQVYTSGPVYDANYIWGSTVYGWHIDTLNALALSDITSQVAQGWTAFGFKYTSGDNSTMLQYGYNALASQEPFLELTYTLSPCSGTPNPGNTLAATLFPCPGVPVHLFLQNNSTLGSGITYQWYHSSGAIAGATDSTYDATVIASSGTFWCVLTCGSSGLTAASAPVTLGVASILNCYCISAATATSDEDIYNVAINGDSTNTLYSYSNGCSTVAPGPGSILKQYSSFLSLPPLTNLVPGIVNNFIIRQDECDGPTYFANRIGIWIDYNQNGNFSDPGEQVFLETTSTTGPRNVTGTFITPVSSLTGTTVMRVVCTEGFTPTPCGYYAYGETEDYLINVGSGTPCTTAPNPGNTIASSGSVCMGTNVNLSLQFPPLLTGNIGLQWYNNSGAIPGATNITYTSTMSSSDSFYCVVTCLSSGSTSASTPVSIQVNMSTSGTSGVTACDQYTWNSMTYTISGNYTGTFTNSNGCDSVHTLLLTVNQSTSSTVSLTGCDSIQFNGNTYTSSGVYIQTLSNAAGCDSNIILTATINQSNSYALGMFGCDSFQFAGNTYTNSGTYILPYTTIYGCDSIITLILNIGQSNSDSITQTACDFYSLNGVVYTASGNYTQTLINASGCDSNIYLNLTINASTDSTISSIACDSYTFNGLNYTNTGVYTQTLPNGAGCDSTITLLVTIDTLNANITINGTSITTSALGTYQWIDCSTNTMIPGATSLNFTPGVSGSYAVIVTTSSCVDTSICVPLWMTGIDGTNATESNFIYPNPNQGLFDIDLKYDCDVLILNDVGETVVQAKMKKGKHAFNLSAYANGVYFLKMKADGKQETIKVIKE